MEEDIELQGKIMKGGIGGDWEFLHHPVGVFVIGGYFLWRVNRKMQVEGIEASSRATASRVGDRV